MITNPHTTFAASGTLAEAYPAVLTTAERAAVRAFADACRNATDLQLADWQGHLRNADGDAEVVGALLHVARTEAASRHVDLIRAERTHVVHTSAEARRLAEALRLSGAWHRGEPVAEAVTRFLQADGSKGSADLAASVQAGCSRYAEGDPITDRLRAIGQGHATPPADVATAAAADQAEADVADALSVQAMARRVMSSSRSRNATEAYAIATRNVHRHVARSWAADVAAYTLAKAAQVGAC